MINNFVCANGMANRKNLAIYCSDDNGKSFHFLTRFVGEDENYFYPHACVSEENETVYITYENKIDHFMVKYSFSELLN